MITDSTFRNQLIDKVLSVYHQKKDRKFAAALEAALKRDNDLDASDLDFSAIADLIEKTMVAEGLIEIYGKPDYAQTTPRGEEVHEKGGWLAYLKEKQAVEQNERTKRELTIKDLELSIRNAELSFFQIKNWWLVITITALFSALSNVLFEKFL